MVKIFLAAAAVAVVTSTALGETAKSAPAARLLPARSGFVMPANAREGRDPFFPDSSRPYRVAEEASHTLAGISALTFKGILGTPGDYVAIINNHAFKVGDESDVRSQDGTAHLRCLEIHPDLVVIEINGQRHELTLSTK